MARIAVVLSGCGVYDGAEIHESVLTLLYLSELKQDVEILAPDKNQHHVINHLTGEETGEVRNCRVEAARIARGPVKSLQDAKASDYDAVILPGGFGAAKNLCNFAFKGAQASLDPQLATLLKEFHKQKKPIGAVCIAPAILALLKKELIPTANPVLTIGSDEGTASAITTLGCRHENHGVDEICVDVDNGFVTSPAYMLGPDIAAISVGIRKMVEKVVSMVKG